MLTDTCWSLQYLNTKLFNKSFIEWSYSIPFKKKKRQNIEDCAPKLSNLNICVCCAPPKNVEITQCIMRYMYWVRKSSSKAKIPSSAEFIEGHKHFYKLSRHEENISFHPRTKRNLQRKKKGQNLILIEKSNLIFVERNQCKFRFRNGMQVKKNLLISLSLQLHPYSYCSISPAEKDLLHLLGYSLSKL